MPQNTHDGISPGFIKMTGFFYAIIIPLSLLPSMLLDIKVLLTAQNLSLAMAEHEQTYRLTTAIEFTMFISVLVLSWCLYTILKPVNKSLSLLAFSLRFGEGLLGCVVILLYLMALQLLNNPEHLQVFDEKQLQGLAYFFIRASASGFDVLLTIMGIGATIFWYLFYISSYIPKALCIWGMVTYAYFIFYGMINIILPDAPEELAFAMAPGALFEVVIGLWFMFKGINREAIQNR
jgi:hypothetical protein